MGLIDSFKDLYKRGQKFLLGMLGRGTANKLKEKIVENAEAEQVKQTVQAQAQAQAQEPAPTPEEQLEAQESGEGVHVEIPEEADEFAFARKLSRDNLPRKLPKGSYIQPQPKHVGRHVIEPEDMEYVERLYSIPSLRYLAYDLSNENLTLDDGVKVRSMIKFMIQRLYILSLKVDKYERQLFPNKIEEDIEKGDSL